MSPRCHLLKVLCDCGAVDYNVADLRRVGASKVNGKEFVVDFKEMAENVAKFRAALERCLHSPEEERRCIRLGRQLKKQIQDALNEFEKKNRSEF